MNVLGIDFGGTKVALRVEGPDGTGVSGRLRIGEGEAAASVLERTFAEARRLVAAAGPIAAVGVSTPGIVHDDHVDLAPNVVGWTDLSLGARLREAFGVTALRIENDVKAAALAESRTGALRDAGTGLYVNLGTGIAIAVVLDDVVLHGAHGAAGEIGYGIIGRMPRTVPVPAGAGAGAGTGAGEAAAAETVAATETVETLEEYAGGSGLGRRSAAAGDVPASDARGLVEAVASSASAERLWTGAIDEIARHLVTAALTVDPARIAIGGGMTAAGDALFAPLTARLTAALPYPPEIVPSAFGADASLRGALILARTAEGVLR
ncbi:glucokinase [Microbacterium resistens]|uniref:Glucokinase n=2 Tax=Microbacterium resistens TaxID=156977 RepID=A0ABU1SGV0_9MICO|nr:glucokinase [Microbacterium resistens]